MYTVYVYFFTCTLLLDSRRVRFQLLCKTTLRISVITTRSLSRARNPWSASTPEVDTKPNFLVWLYQRFLCFGFFVFFSFIYEKDHYISCRKYTDRHTCFYQTLREPQEMMRYFHRRIIFLLIAL